MPLLLVHPLGISPLALRAVILDTVGNLADGFHFAGFHLPAKYSLRWSPRLDDVARHLGATLIFLLGTDLGAGGQSARH